MGKFKTPYIFIIGTIGAALVIITVIIFGSNTKEKAIPVVKTLAQTNMIWNDENMWEDDFSESLSTSITETIKTISFPIDLNSAAFDELIQIKGIGEATANNILKYRNEHGIFSSVDELDDVDGIGQASIDKWRDYLYVDESVLTVESTILNRIIIDINEDIVSEVKNNGLININTATIEELMSLDGIGEVTAEKIYNYAREKGFTSVDDIINIDGIGEKKLERLRSYICV